VCCSVLQRVAVCCIVMSHSSLNKLKLHHRTDTTLLLHKIIVKLTFEHNLLSLFPATVSRGCVFQCVAVCCSVLHVYGNTCIAPPSRDIIKIRDPMFFSKKNIISLLNLIEKITIELTFDLLRMKIRSFCSWREAPPPSVIIS